MTGLSTLSVDFSSNQYMLVGDVAPLKFTTSDAFSFSCWVNSSLSTNTILSKFSGTQGYRLYTDSTGKIFWTISNNTGNATTIRTRIPYISSVSGASVWNHVVVTHTNTGTGLAASNLAIFVNGHQVNTVTVEETLSGSIDTTTGFQVSGYNTTNDTWFGGIDEVAAYNTALTAAQVQTIYNDYQPVNHAVTGPTASLVGYWRMGEGATFPTIPDDSVNANDGALTSMVSGDIESDYPIGPLALEDIFSALTTTTTAITTSYLMRGIDTAGPYPSYHYWLVTGTPDLDGSEAGSLPYGGPLNNIVIARSFNG